MRLGAWLPVLLLAGAAAAQTPVRSWEGSVTIPTYEHSGRETEPPLFANSSVTGIYPFTTFLMPFTAGSPKPRTYRAIFVENEYLKLTYLPDLGGRIFSLFDKLRAREVFYRNDVIKPAGYNPRNTWPISGLELTGPHDVHMLTFKGEPFWANKVVRRADGAVSLVLGEFDPVYQMRVSYTATLHPGVAAMEISIFCYNPRPGRMPQMFWLSAAVQATPKLRFYYPMSRTIGHTTADIADWPVHTGVDYSWDRNNKNMLGVFGIDVYDDFQGAYQHDRDYGIFRYADRRIVQGMKMWTFGYGPAAKGYERGYTDNGGPYVEVQSGRHVWDGYYEWVGPHKTESWSEWWVPVAGTGGLTTLTRDVALNLDVQPDAAGGADFSLALAAMRVARGATLLVESAGGVVLREKINLDPAKPIQRRARTAQLAGLSVSVTDATGHALLQYRRPESDPGRKEYTPITRVLEEPRKPAEQMSIEELVLAAEFKLKGLNAPAALALLESALARDPGFSRAHLLLGIHHFTAGRYAAAAGHLEKAVARDSYSDEGYYYLDMSQFALGQTRQAERNLYLIWPNSAFFGAREYNLGRLALRAGDAGKAESHLRRAITANGDDLAARLLLALTLRKRGDQAGAVSELGAVTRLDPANSIAQAERYFLRPDPPTRAELLRLLGGQAQEALSVSAFYRDILHWKDAVQILHLTVASGQDPWGPAPEFYYVQAYCQRRAGDAAAAGASLKMARASAGKVDRFPYREESLAPLEEAVASDPRDAVARYALACLLYARERQAEAIRHWEAAVDINSKDFSSRRALGLAYAEQGLGVEKAVAQMEQAVALRPLHTNTFNDLSTIYASAGRFEDQAALLEKALAAKPGDDSLTEALLTAMLQMGRYDDAERLIAQHTFAPRHRTYGLRDKYRLMRIATAGQAFQRGDHGAALKTLESARQPPISLGLDDFQSQSSPRLEYLLGRVLEASGRTADARTAYESSAAGIATLSGDRDSWNSENFFMTLSLRRLGRTQEAVSLEQRFENFALTEVDSSNMSHRAEARFLLGLLRKHAGQPAEARRLMNEALKAQPDSLAARIELRGESFDPLLK